MNMNDILFSPPLAFEGMVSPCLTGMAIRVIVTSEIMRTNKIHMLTSEMSELDGQVEKIYHMASGREMAYGKKQLNLNSKL